MAKTLAAGGQELSDYGNRMSADSITELELINICLKGTNERIRLNFQSKDENALIQGSLFFFRLAIKIFRTIFSSAKALRL